MPNRRKQHFSSRRSHVMSRNYNSVSYASVVKLGPVAHTILIALMITVLGLIYLTQATRVTSYDYKAQEIESQIAELAVQKSDLEIENARLTAMQTVHDSSTVAAMTEPTSTSYAQN